MADVDTTAWFEALLKSAEDRTSALESAHRQARDGGFLAKLTLHKYQCLRGCQLATVFRAGGATLCAVRDYKYSPGLNLAQSVPEARAKNTIDGDRHWPAHVYDVDEIAEWGEGTGMSVNCRHYRGLLEGTRVLNDVASATPGHPGKPTRLH